MAQIFASIKSTLGALAILCFAVASAAQAQDAEPLPDLFLGNADAPIEIIEYASFTCPHCASFHTSVYPRLKADYIESGKVKFIFREVYFDKFGLWAGMLARCGGDEKYFGMVDLLFKKQKEWARGDGDAAIVGNMYEIGRQAGMTDDAMRACMQDQENAQALVADFQLKAGADDVQSTPTFIIDGEKMQNMPYSEFQTILDGKLN